MSAKREAPPSRGNLSEDLTAFRAVLENSDTVDGMCGATLAQPEFVPHVTGSSKQVDEVRAALHESYLARIEPRLHAVLRRPRVHRLVRELALGVDAVHVVELRRLRRAEAELHDFVARGLERAREELRVALVDDLLRPLHRDARRRELRERRIDRRELRLPLRLQHVVRLDVVLVLAGIPEMIGADDQHPHRCIGGEARGRERGEAGQGGSKQAHDVDSGWAARLDARSTARV